KPLEPVQRFFNPSFAFPARPVPHPSPLLHQQLPSLSVGLEIDGGHYLVSQEHRQGKVAEHPLCLWDVGLEPVLVAEKETEALALIDERVERREDVDQFTGWIG